MTARHLALSPHRSSTSELLGAAAGRRGMAPAEVAGPISGDPEHDAVLGFAGEPLAAADPDLVPDVVLAAARPAGETAERDRDFVRPA